MEIMKNETAVMLTLSVTVAIGFGIGVGVGSKFTENIIQTSAIEAGAGHWTINPVNGDKKFEWIGRDPAGPIEKTEIENRYPNGK